jgi:hypothetical protein
MNPPNQDDAEWHFQDDEELGFPMILDCDLQAGPIHSGTSLSDALSYPSKH